MLVWLDSWVASVANALRVPRELFWMMGSNLKRGIDEN